MMGRMRWPQRLSLRSRRDADRTQTETEQTLPETDPELELVAALEAYAASSGKELRKHFRRSCRRRWRDVAEMKDIISDWEAEHSNRESCDVRGGGSVHLVGTHGSDATGKNRNPKPPTNTVAASRTECSVKR